MAAIANPISLTAICYQTLGSLSHIKQGTCLTCHQKHRHCKTAATMFIYSCHNYLTVFFFSILVKHRPGQAQDRCLLMRCSVRLTITILTYNMISRSPKKRNVIILLIADLLWQTNQQHHIKDRILLLEYKYC